MRKSALGRPWVLVTDGAPDHGQSRTTLWTVRALAAGGYRAAVTVSAPFSLAATSRYCDRSVPVPAVERDPEGYAAAIRAELQRERYVTVLPTSDPAVAALNLPGAALLDKAVLVGAAERAGIPCPPTQVFEKACDLLDAGPGFAYPVIVKPALGHAAGRASTPDDLARWRDLAGPLLVQPYLHELHAVAGVVWGGEMVAAVHQRFLRTWPVDAGMTCAAVTTEPDAAVEAALLRLLQGYSGPFQADLAGSFLLDVNPRSFATLSLAMAAGLNLIAIYCDLLLGAAPSPAHARPGVFYRWLDADLRHTIQRVRSHEVSLRGPALRSCDHGLHRRGADRSP